MATTSKPQVSPVIVGLYRLPGSGKSTLLKQLGSNLPPGFTFYEGSDVLGKVTPGGMAAFRKLNELDQEKHRKLAVDKIREITISNGTTAIVAGHYMFWPEDRKYVNPVYTQNDLETYTHIIYLDVLPEIILYQCRGDTERLDRPLASIDHFRKWQEAEKAEIRTLCYNNNILFWIASVSSLGPQLLEKICTMILDFRQHSEAHNHHVATQALDDAIERYGKGMQSSTEMSPDGDRSSSLLKRQKLETMLVVDADRTLAAVDTGMMFWEWLANNVPILEKDKDVLNTLFSSELGYSYTAFRQAMLLYEESGDFFEVACRALVSRVDMYPEL
jgi:adenylate kinase